MSGRRRTSRIHDVDHFSTLIDSVYAAAADPAHWSVFLEGLAKTLSAKSGMFRVVDEQNTAIRANVHYNLDPDLQEAHRRYYVQKDVFIDSLRGKPAGFIGPGERICSLRELQRTEFFADYMRPQDSFHVCGGLAMRNEHLTIKFGVQRDRRRGPFTEDEATYLKRFVPHIQRAACLGHLLSRIDHQRAMAEEALESMGVGVLLMDEGNTVVHLNRKSESLLHGGFGLKVSEGALRATDQGDHQKLRDALLAARRRNALSAPPVPEAILLTPKPDGPRLLVVVSPVRATHSHFHGPWPRASVAVFVSNLSDAGLLNHEVLMALYGLTNAEARLAVAIATGADLAGLSREWNVSRETLRTHLKRVLGKTGASRQADLVRLLAGKPWNMAAETVATSVPFTDMYDITAGA